MKNWKMHLKYIGFVLMAAMMPVASYAVSSKDAESGSHVKFILYAGIAIAALIDLWYEIGGGRKKKLQKEMEERQRREAEALHKPGKKGQPGYKKKVKTDSGKTGKESRDVRHIDKKK